ncbi:hypothetical protein SAMN02745667_00880 [Nereida ignava DSM 16309]|nr:hypothetical protein SAMN02745667_00880 [Nereida ignava DSM 16309]
MSVVCITLAPFCAFGPLPLPVEPAIAQDNTARSLAARLGLT